MSPSAQEDDGNVERGDVQKRLRKYNFFKLSKYPFEVKIAIVLRKMSFVKNS